MAEIDYQLALLLQHQFEQEAKKPKEHKSDTEFARVLQEQFQLENELDVPKNGLVYKSTKSTHNSSSCLVDPSWEVIDPTPDIHVLFLSFNDRFFWGALVTVCVSWSKRMTSCAGICSYQGRGGLCSITLSEPLLKLRPRKDLVETLLHEMIHAYLFVTNNNRDRDGHGPEFHKHMFRINKEAGTNITVYHDFHDEVRLYKQHWWRCDGPCQKWKPYFGMVRRATNRAPGPSDRWWGEHSRNCGGKFVKVQEPENYMKKSSAKENVKPKEDIRKYISPIKTVATDKGTSKPITSTITSVSSTVTTNNNNVHTINNSDSSKKIRTVIPKANNIFGFTNLSGNASSSKGKGMGTALKNSSSTIVINKKPSTASKTNSIAASPGQILSDSSTNNGSIDYSVVRNHWLNKFPSGNGVKRTASVGSQDANKIPRLNEESNSSDTIPKDEAKADCPVCLESVLLARFNEHLDNCLQQPKTRKCIICECDVFAAEFEMHVRKCSEESFDNTRRGLKKCTICEKMFPVAEYDTHVEKCLLKFYDNMEDAYCDKGDRVDCLTCGKDILRGELDAHLDDCMGLSRVFEDGNAPVEGESVDSCDNNKFNCPFCMVLVSEGEMSAHLDSCLNTPSTAPEGELNKSVLIRSLLDEDF
ncbi:sprT-like domain-containing protein Spartan [Anoplophora glabripennis]|uniref:sprT-like domain-containing protein Spartan n=1 Tax=Anoplophora glabripennis TaxID=217634 RepID=UPI00087485DB|nr:sprT-like domain-containing protein Spartan [Anoplophora glabripennis]